MTPEALSFCSVPDHEDSGSPQNSNSYIYNAMIHPIIKFTITGAIWYQGKFNDMPLTSTGEARGGPFHPPPNTITLACQKSMFL